ncbi:Peroxidase 9 [Glycine soja]
MEHTITKINKLFNLVAILVTMHFIKLTLLAMVAFCLSVKLSLANPGFHFGWGGHHHGEISFGLSPQFYQFSCPQANDIVMSVLEKAIAKDMRIAASLLRLHFHDCFVQGCDASILLDDSARIVSEKNSGPNKNSVRGFEVIDKIKSKLEEACPQTVSCADILALAARGSTVLSGGPNWELPLGRRDSKTASLSGSNKNIPPPNATIENLVTFFKRQGLDEVDLVALSGGTSTSISCHAMLNGAHTIGVARCATFKQRLYNQKGNNQPDENLEKSFYFDLKTMCPKSGGDNFISPLDFGSPRMFDNTYFKLILRGKGLLNSDEVLLMGNVKKTRELVKKYAQDESLFFEQFSMSMIKMGNLRPLIGFNGEVRKNCRRKKPKWRSIRRSKTCALTLMALFSLSSSSSCTQPEVRNLEAPQARTESKLQNPLEFMRSKLVLMVSHELSLSPRFCYAPPDPTSFGSPIRNLLNPTMMSSTLWRTKCSTEECRIKMPETYAVHLGNSRELMEVAEDIVAKRVLREHVWQSLGVRNDDLLFGIINSVSRGKGQDLFLRSFYESLLLIQEKKLQVPSLHAIVVGSDMNTQTKFETELRQFVMEKKIQDHVHFVNKTLVVAPYLASIDVLVQNCQAEAAAAAALTRSKRHFYDEDNDYVEHEASVIQEVRR